MNKIDFSHTGGFELTQDILDFLQEANIAAGDSFLKGSKTGCQSILLSSYSNNQIAHVIDNGQRIASVI